MYEMRISADGTCSGAGVQFCGERTQFLVFAAAVPLAWEGRLGGIDGSRIIFAMIIYSIRVSNSTSPALGREKAVVGTA